MFFSNKDLKDKITSLEEENKELKAQAGSVESLQSDNNRLSEELAEAKNSLEVAGVKLSESEKVATEAGEIKALAEKAISEQPEKVAALAAQEVASMGHPPVDKIEEDESSESNLSVFDQYAKLPVGDKRDKFFSENKTKLMSKYGNK
jgi:DNA repair exonuclease SbcCD ATPase subunit